MDVKQFLRDRNQALLSLDEVKIKEFAKKYGTNWEASCSEVFWRAVHKARTAIPDLPLEARVLSKKWLRDHNSESFDDGDVDV